MIKTILYSDGTELLTGTSLNLGPVSCGIYHTVSIYCICDSDTSIKVSTKIGRILNQWTSDFNPIFKTSPVTLIPKQLNNEYVLPIHILYRSDKQTNILDTILIDNMSISLAAEFVSKDERLSVLLNNFGWTVDDSWYKAFLSTDNSENIDNIKVNEKMRELLLDFFTLTQLKGTYKSLQEGIEFFEFSGRIEVLEYWYDKTNDKYILVSRNDSKNVNQDQYTKTKYISLHYSINVQDQTEPVDDNGIPNMIEEFIWNHEMFTKLCNLKQILQKYFLPDDVLIVDISGEHISFAVFQQLFWTGELKISNNDESKKFSDIVVEEWNPDGKDGFCPIKAHTCLLDLQVYGITTDTKYPLRFLHDSAHSSAPLYRVISTDPNSSVNDYEFVTSIWSGDCAIVGFDIKQFSSNPKMTYTYSLEQLNGKTWQRVYIRRNMTKTELDREQKFAIRTAGHYRIVLYAFDRYDSYNEWSFEYDIDYPPFVPRIRVLSPKYLNSTKSKIFRVRDIFFDEPIELQDIRENVGARDLAMDSYDVNDLASNQGNIIRRYSNNTEQNLIEFNLKQLRNVPLSKLNNVPLSEYTDGYEGLLFKLSEIPDSGKIQIIAYKSDLEESIEYTSYMELLSIVRNEYWEFDIQYVSMRNSEQELEEPELYLMLLSKERGTNHEEFEFRFNDVVLNPVYTWHNFPYFSKGPSLRIFDNDEHTVLKPKTGTLSISYGTRTFVKKRVKISTVHDLFELTKDLPELIVTEANNHIAFTSLQFDLTIEHPSIGKRYACYRKSPIESLYNAEQSLVADPGTYIFCICDMDWKIDNFDVIWNVYDHITNAIVNTTLGYMLKFTSLISGSYDVELTIQDKRTYKIMSTKKYGCITIR